MINRFWSGLLMVLLLSGCGWNGTPTRPNDFTKLTSITISAVSATIANGTSTKLIATGHYSGQFSRDITDQVVWTSDSPAVADFGTAAPNKNRVSSVLFGATDTLNKAVVITATVEGVTSAPFTLTVSPATINSVTVTPATVSVANGLSTQFEAKGVFSDTSTQDLTFDATWKVTKITDPIAASISDDQASKGLAKGLAEGSATITATFSGVATNTATLTVTPAILQSITVTTDSYSIAGISKTVPFKAMANYSAGPPEDVTTNKVKWLSSLTGVATIDANTGIATTVAVGTTSISATLNGISGNANLTVQDFTLQISPSSKTLSISTANTQQMTVTATFTGASPTDVTSACVWTPDSAAVASVSSGLVTAVAVGATNINAKYGGKSVSATISVTQ